jgi:hypothetical protein
VLTNQAKSPKSQARDIQSALMAAFGVMVDHRIISVAQISSEMVESVNFRLKFTGLSIRLENGLVCFTVELVRQGETFTGAAKGASIPTARRHTAAEATLQAVERSCGGKRLFELISVDMIEVSGTPMVACQIWCKDGSRLLGSAFADTDTDAAVVHAVLHGINRKLAILGAE